VTAMLPSAARVEDLSVETCRDGAMVVVTVRGEVDIATAPLLRAVLDGIYAARPRRVEMDLSGVTFLDSHALTTLIAARRRLAAGDVALVLRPPSRPVARVLAVSGLDRVFETSTSRSQGHGRTLPGDPRDGSS
jgi:anti-anti-sigma factor